MLHSFSQKITCKILKECYTVSMRNSLVFGNQEKIQTNCPLREEQIGLLCKLNSFAHYQAGCNYEVQCMPAKAIYKVNEELKLALVALMVTCSMLDPRREGNETEKFFEKEIKIIQKNATQKYIDFGDVRPFLLQHFLIPEIVDDWILYRDVAGDGIHALMDRKTVLQGLPTYSRGGSPVYEFSRFYRKFMEDKVAKKKIIQDDFKQVAMKALTEQLINQQLTLGHSPQEILDRIMNDDLLKITTPDDKTLLPKK